MGRPQRMEKGEAMNTIKYRIFDKENKCWLDKSFHKHIMIRPNGTLTWWSGKDKFNDFASDKFEISVFTGQIDKNGRALCMGDFVKVNHPHKNRKYTGEIIFDGWKFTGKKFWFSHFDVPGALFSEGTKYIEYIGNRFEHPELLEKK